MMLIKMLLIFFSGKWYITAYLPAGEEIQVKLAIVSPGPGYVFWEPGPNKVIAPRMSDCAVGVSWACEMTRLKGIKLPRDLCMFLIHMSLYHV